MHERAEVVVMVPKRREGGEGMGIEAQGCACTPNVRRCIERPACKLRAYAHALRR